MLGDVDEQFCVFTSKVVWRSGAFLNQIAIEDVFQFFFVSPIGYCPLLVYHSLQGKIVIPCFFSGSTTIKTNLPMDHRLSNLSKKRLY